MADTVESLEDSLALLEKLQTQVRHATLLSLLTNTNHNNRLTFHTARRIALHNPKPGLTSRQTSN
jgi:hypothetical protein